MAGFAVRVELRRLDELRLEPGDVPIADDEPITATRGCSKRVGPLNGSTYTASSTKSALKVFARPSDM